MGNLDSLRDWGHAKDYVQMQWLMLQQEEPNDFVIATGIQKSVREFIEISSKYLGWNKLDSNKGIIWEGEGIKEIGKRADTGDVVIKIDPRYFRPTEVKTLLGNSLKAKEILGWEPRITLEEMIEEMISNDIKEAKKERLLNQKGYKIATSIENPPNII